MLRLLTVDTSQYSPISPFFDEAAKDLAASHDLSAYFFDQHLYEPRGLSGALISRIKIRTGSLAIDKARANRELVAACRQFNPTVILVCKGAWIFPRTLMSLRQSHGPALRIVNFASDDPFNARLPSGYLIQSIPHYDLYTTPRLDIIADLQTAGARNILYVPFGYKPSIHFPEQPKTHAERAAFEADIAFIGTCDNERAQWIAAIIRRFVKNRIALYGSNWDRYRQFKTYWRGPAVGRDYRLAASGAKVTVNLVRTTNRDGNSMRTFELTAMRACMIAQSTSEHKQLFSNSRWNGSFDTVFAMEQLIAEALNNPELRDHLANAGHEHITQGQNTYRDRLLSILCKAKSIAGA